MGLTVNRQMAKKLTVNRQKRNIFTVNRQMSEPKLAAKFLRYPTRSRPIAKWGHQLVEQAINTYRHCLISNCEGLGTSL